MDDQACEPPASFMRQIVAIFAGVITAGTLGWIGGHLAPAENQYAIWLFCLIPMLAGLAASLSLGTKRAPSYKVAAWLGFWTYFAACILALCTAYEGVVCLIMAAPLGIPVTIAGSCLGTYVLQKIRARRSAKTILCVAPTLPIVFAYSLLSIPDQAVRTESTTILIDAPVERVWPLLFSMKLETQPEWLLFRLGIAHPVAVSSFGRAVGDRRDCVLSTGTMPERISAVEPNRRLRFEVLDTPPTMRELNPFFQITTKHLTGYYQCHYGEFRLERVAGGRTRLTGTSNYGFEIYPAPYWGLWTDTVVEQVHLQVMRRIKQVAESGRPNSSTVKTGLTQDRSNRPIATSLQRTVA